MRKLNGFKTYIWLFTGLFIFYLILSPFVVLYGTSDATALATDPYDGDANVKLVMAALLFILFAAALLISFRRRMTAGRLIIFVILAGVVLRFGYMLYTPFYIRGHDVGSLNGYGHLAYMHRLFNLEGLPASNGNQFYHPPFQHIAGAVIAKIFALLTGAKDTDTIFEAAKLIPCFASCALLVTSCRLFDEFGFSKRAKTIAVTLIAFHPTFIILSASINNDMLMIFFMMTAFLYTIRWYKDQSYKNILLLALSIGAAMSTKFSGGLIAVFTAFVFLIVLLRRIRNKNAAGLVNQFAAFALVCFPLGLWYHIRNLKLFGQAIGYVAQMKPDSALYVGNVSFVERFFSFSLPDMLHHVYCNPYDDFRLWEYTVKCALFGEFTFSPEHNAFAVILIVSSLLLILLTLFAMVWFLIFDRKKNRLAVLCFAALWALLMLSFVFFNIAYPFGCTMDFRYIVPTVLTGAAFLGLLSDKLKNDRTGKALFAGLMVILGVFCVSSAAFYIV
jgi:4-amino-4-deoxy-L-arabinose transferase-like glycosyltransferase